MASPLLQSAPANSEHLLKGDFERMARRRFQQPTPFREGAWWWIYVRQDEFRDGKLQRVPKRIKLAPAEKREREVLKLRDEYLRPMNQGLRSIGGATSFKSYVEDTYIPVVLPLLAKSTQGRSKGVINNYLIPAFGPMSLNELDALTIQRYFTGMTASKLQHDSVDKIRDVLSSILGSACEYHLLVKNPAENVKLPRNTTGKRTMPTISFEQFDQLIDLIAEPYATMIYVAVYSGLRVSELIGLKWEDVRTDSLMVDERYCRGDWSAPKSTSSNAPVPVLPHVLDRIHALKDKVVAVRAGRAVRKYACIKSANPDDLVFQSVRKGAPMRDNNILVRHIKPAAKKLALPFVNWKCLRTSCGTWLLEHGANIKDIQAHLRHSRASTTMDVYTQYIPESHKRAVASLPVRRVM